MSDDDNIKEGDDLLEAYGLDEDVEVPFAEVLGPPAPTPPTPVSPPTSATSVAELLGYRRPPTTTTPGRKPAKYTYWQIAFDTLHLKPGETQTTSVKPGGTKFRGEKFVAVESIPGSTVIESLFIGTHNQFPIAGSIYPTANFMPNALGSSIPLDDATKDMTISITVKNISDKDVTWNGMIYGKMVK